MAQRTDEDQAAESAEQARYDGCRPQPRAGPQLLPADIPRVTQLANAIRRETRGVRRFAAFQVGEFADAAQIMVRYRIQSMEVLRRTQKDARAMFARDLREVERRSFPEMHLPIQILGNFPPRQLQIRPNAEDPAYGEIVIPARLREFTASLSGIGGLPKHTHEMANYIS